MTGDPIGNSAIVNTAKALSKPLRLAIEKLSAGAAKLYEPTHVRRMAKAEADAEFIRNISDQDIAELSKAAENRSAYRKIRQELNLQLIADRASRHFEEATIPLNASPPPDEWVDEFTDQSKDASTDELRELWARLYVAETKQSGSVPRRILRTVRDLDASLARKFTSLLACSITADDGRIVVLTFNGWLDGLDLTARNVQELEDVELIKTTMFVSTPIRDGCYRLNQDRILRLTFEKGKKLNISAINLTSAGIAIAAVAEREINEQYVKNLCAAAEKAGAKAEYPLFEGKVQ